MDDDPAKPCEQSSTADHGPFWSVDELLAEMQEEDEAAALREMEHEAGTGRLEITARWGTARGKLRSSLVGERTPLSPLAFADQMIGRGGDGTFAVSHDSQPGDIFCWRDLKIPDAAARAFLERRRRKRKAPSSAIEACLISAAATKQEEPDKDAPRNTAALRSRAKIWLARFVADKKHVRRDDTVKEMLITHPGLRGALDIFQEYSREHPKLRLSAKGRPKSKS